MVLEKILESPLDCKEIQPINSEGDQPWDFFGRNDAKAETPVLWPPHAKILTNQDFININTEIVFTYHGLPMEVIEEYWSEQTQVANRQYNR